MRYAIVNGTYEFRSPYEIVDHYLWVKNNEMNTKYSLRTLYSGKSLSAAPNTVCG